LLEHRVVEIGQPLEVRARLAHLVLAEPGQQGLLTVAFAIQVHHQFAAADGEAHEGRLAGTPALVGALVDAVADDARSPHSGRLPRDLPEQRHQGLAVRALLRVGA